MKRRRGHREASKPSTTKEVKNEPGFQWVPLWGWVLIFLVPLILSEIMFWNVGKIPSMIIFPIAWIGFWYVMLKRSDWQILKNIRKQKDAASDEEA